jgi:hypothetical protein
MRILLFFCSFFLPAVLLSQSEYVNKLLSEADKAYHDGNLPEALLAYEKLIKADSTKTYYCYMAGLCHTTLRKNLSLAVQYFSRAERESQQYPDFFYQQGMAYMYGHDLKNAINSFQKYKEMNKEKKGGEAGRLIEMCISGMELMNAPVKVSFTNMGPAVNSTMDELYPFVPEDEAFVIFSSNKRYDPVYRAFDENIYVSYAEKNEWTFPVQLRNISTYENEYPAGISHGGKLVYICTHQTGSYSEIQMWKNRGKSMRADETNPLHALTMSKKWVDGFTMNEEMDLIIVSARYENTYGGSDLYVFRKLPDGTWSNSRNLGALVNTTYDEVSPQLSADGTTLYFASRGHNSMGGFDLFVSNMNEVTGEWSKPRNLGYPINTSSDNLSISFNRSRKYAYVSTFRNDGYGGLDLYRVNFLDVDDPCTVITGYVGVKDSSGVHKWDKSLYDLSISVFDSQGNVYGSYTYNAYLERFVAILPPGKYQFVIESEGYQKFTEDIEIMDRNLFIPEMDREFIIIDQ